MLIGSHVSMSGKKMLEAASESAAGFGANTFMIYTGAPQNTRRKKIEDLNIEAGQAHMKEQHLKYRRACALHHQYSEYRSRRGIRSWC